MKKLGFIFLFSAQFLFSSQIPPEIRDAINETLQGKHIFEFFDRNKVIDGFDSTTRLSDVNPGDPVLLYTMTQKTFETTDKNAPVSSLIVPESWYVPLYVKGDLKKTVLVIGSCVPEDRERFIGTRNAKELIEVFKKIKCAWPESLGYHPQLISMQEPYLNSLCFFVPEKGDSNLTVIGSYYLGVKLLPDINYSSLSLSKETFNSLRSKINKMVSESQARYEQKQQKDKILAEEIEKKTEPLWKDREISDNKAYHDKYKLSSNVMVS